MAVLGGAGREAGRISQADRRGVEAPPHRGSGGGDAERRTDESEFGETVTYRYRDRMPRKIFPRKILPVILLLALAALRSPGASDPSRYAPFGDGQVHYESYGAGHDAVVYIHGWTCDLTFWRGQEPVYRNHRSLLIDLPGHGLSDKPNV